MTSDERVAFEVDVLGYIWRNHRERFAQEDPRAVEVRMVGLSGTYPDTVVRIEWLNVRRVADPLTVSSYPIWAQSRPPVASGAGDTILYDLWAEAHGTS